MVEKTTTTCMTQPLRTNKQISNNNNEDPLSSHIETSKRTGSLASSSYSTCPDSEESPPSSAPHSPLNTSARENTPAAAPEVEDEEEGFSKQEEEENREEDLPSTISPPPSPPFAEGEKEFTPAASDNEATPVPLPPDDEGAAEDCKEIPSPEGKDAEEIPNMSPNSSRPDPVATPSTEQLPQSKCHALSPDNLSPNFQEFMSLLKVDDPDNARDDDNAAASSGDDLVEPADKGDLKEEGADATTPNDNDVAVVNESNTEISGSPSHPPVASPADNNLDVTPNYNVLQYSYVHRHAPALADFTKVSNSKSTLGKRCYRLNLERPFDIHCEQSPLEYGNYMAPWTKEVQPSTVGPTEYCPPRHLGGEEAVWRELMRWSHGSGSVRNEDVVADAIEDKTGSAGEVYESGVTSSYTSGIGGSGWRKLQPKEFLAVKKLREYNNEGELTFQTYDLSHAVLDKDGLDAHNATVMRDTTTLGEGGIQSAPPPSIHTIFSVDSNTSAEERLNRKSPEETADATSRLFRRSEISLQEAAEKEEEARMLKTQQEEEEKRLVKERQKLERGSSRRGSLKLGKSFKKMVRKMSSSGSSSQSSRNLSQKAVVGKAANAALMRRCSVQASQIDKARDMVDGCDDGEGGLIITPGDGQTAGKSSDLIDAVQKKTNYLPLHCWRIRCTQ